MPHATTILPGNYVSRMAEKYFDESVSQEEREKYFSDIVVYLVHIETDGDNSYSIFTDISAAYDAIEYFARKRWNSNKHGEIPTDTNVLIDKFYSSGSACYLVESLPVWNMFLPSMSSVMP